MTEKRIRAGDHVHHKPSGEDWVILWADYSTGYLAPAGWPASEAQIQHCDVTKSLSDDEHQEFLDSIATSDHAPCQKAIRMYRPTPA